MPADFEIFQEDFLLRRIHKKTYINELGEIRPEAFLLRVMKDGKHEKEVSLIVEKICPSHTEARSNDPDANMLCRFKAKEARKLLLGIYHSPSSNTYYHASLCGFITIKKAIRLIKISEKID